MCCLSSFGHALGYLSEFLVARKFSKRSFITARVFILWMECWCRKFCWFWLQFFLPCCIYSIIWLPSRGVAGFWWDSERIVDEGVKYFGIIEEDGLTWMFVWAISWWRFVCAGVKRQGYPPQLLSASKNEFSTFTKYAFRQPQLLKPLVTWAKGLVAQRLYCFCVQLLAILK